LLIIVALFCKMETVVLSFTFFLLIVVPSPINAARYDPSLALYSIPSPMPLSPCVPHAPIGMYALGNGNTMHGILKNTTFVDRVYTLGDGAGTG